MKSMKRIVALLVTIVMCLSICPMAVTAEGKLSKPDSAPAFSTYTDLDGIAFTSEVAGMNEGDRYIDYWCGEAYTFTVGVDVAATFEEACALSGEQVPSVFALPGNQGDLTITAPVNVYGYYYAITPNTPIVDAAVCPPRNSARDAGMETTFNNIYIKDGTLGSVYVAGFTLAGTFYDNERAISSEATDITLENVVVCQEEAAAPYQHHAFVVSNPNNTNSAESAAENKDSFTLRNCRLENMISARIFSNQIPPQCTIDGIVSVAGCTTFYGFPQWRRYMNNPVYTLTNCYFEDFAASDGREYFLVIEGLNKFNGACTINVTNNVFGGDADDYMIQLFPKVGYDININGNTFLAKSKSNLIPFYWNISYDTEIYSDYATNADVSNVDLSSVADISNNRFIGYTNFKYTANSITAFDISDNFFTTDLSGYKTVLGATPTYNEGWKLSGYWVDYDLSVHSTSVPEIYFNHAAVHQTENGFLIYSDSASVNLYDWELIVPKGISINLSSGESLSSISLNAGTNARTLTVYSYDGTASEDYELTLYYNDTLADAIKRLQNAYIRLNAGCYTNESLAGYADAIEAVKQAIEQGGDVAAALAKLDSAEAGLAYKAYNAKADVRYYELFADLSQFTISNTDGWKKFADLVNTETTTFSGKTVTLIAPLNFGGETIEPVGGRYLTNSIENSANFCGTFDGGCYLIENFVIDKPEYYGVGLFGRTYNATVKNVRIGKATVKGYDKIGGLAGFGDATTFTNCSSAADVIATHGGNGIAGLVSQARSGAKMTDCINYGSVTCPNGRANGIMAWGQTTAVLTRCINYGQLSGDDFSYPVGRWDDAYAIDYATKLIDCYYVSSKVPQEYATVLDNLNVNELAWKLDLYVSDGRLAIKNVGKKVYRIGLNCGAMGVRYFYGPAGEPVSFNVPGYYVSEVLNGTQVIAVANLTYSRNSNYTATMIPYDYTVTYVLNGGTFTTDVVREFNVEKEFSLPSGSMISRDGYIFAGWYLNSELSGARQSSVPKGTIEDVTFYAKYVSVDYEISTAAQLVSLASTVNGGKNLAGKGVKLTADIDLSGTSFSGIGNSVLTPFAGILDGAGHRISGLNISGVPVAGVVGVLSEGGIVSNLLVEGNVSGKLAGGIVGNNLGGIVENCSFDGAVSSSPTKIKVITQNVRVDSSSDLHGAADRHTPLKNILLAQDPDVIGFQECGITWKNYLTRDFSGYDYVWKYRGEGSNTLTKGYEATPIFYKKNKFDLLDSGHFWLSDTPNKASYCFNESMNRICSWVKLRVKETGEIFYFFNTHFPLDDESRVKSTAVLKSKVDSIVGKYAPYFLTADWNCSKPSNGYSALTAWNDDYSLIAKVDATNGSGTYNGFNVQPSHLIDICFGRKNTVTIPYYKVLLDTYVDSEGRECPPSDHYGAYYEMELQSGAGGIVGNNEGAVSTCVAANSGSAEPYLGTICAKNLGSANGLYLSGNACGMNVGADNCFTEKTIADGLFALNQKMGLAVWGQEGEKPVLRPRGERIYLIQYLDFMGAVAKTTHSTIEKAKEWYPDYDDAATVFSEWTVSVLGDVATLTPVMQASVYTVRFLDYEGNVIKTQIVTYGAGATAPNVGPVAGYTFMGWDCSFSSIKSDTTVRPLYLKENQFTLTLLAEGDFTSLSINGESVEAGAQYSAVGGTTLNIRAGDGFLYWKDENNRVYSENAVLNLPLTHHTTLTAVYATAKRYTVTFIDMDATVLETQIVVRTAFVPDEPSREGLTFVGWDKSYRNLKEDVVIRAMYTSEQVASVTVIGGSASSDTVLYGETVTVTPDQTEGFVGWSMNSNVVFSTKETLTITVWDDIKLTAIYAEAEHRSVAISVSENGNVQLIRRVEGDYTVLGSGILYADSTTASLLRECVGIGDVRQQSDYALTLNGTALFTVENVVYVRGYVVLLDEQTGETIVQYTPVYLNK